MKKTKISNGNSIEKPQTRWDSAKRILLGMLWGGMLGYLVLHPASMFIHYRFENNDGSFWHFLIDSFSADHLIMALFFCLLGIIGGYFCGIHHDRIARLNWKLRIAANTDYLTSLYNRRYFMKRLKVEIERAQRYERLLSILLIDIDHFKEYNDNFGHQQGDMLLQIISEYFTVSVRKSDLVGRYGGEEFIVIMPEAGKENAGELAERIRSDVESGAFHKKSENFQGAITVSIGVAEFPTDGGDLDTLFTVVDNALYKAKELGRNTVFSFIHYEE